MGVRTVIALTLSVALTSFAMGWIGARLGSSENNVSAAGFGAGGDTGFSVLSDESGASGRW